MVVDFGIDGINVFDSIDGIDGIAMQVCGR